MNVRNRDRQRFEPLASPAGDQPVVKYTNAKAMAAVVSACMNTVMNLG